MKKVFVEQIRERDWVESPFLVRDKIMAMAKNGKPYMTLKLMDRSGEVEGRVWDRVDELAELFERDDFVLVKGKASVYMGKMQIVIQDLERLPEETVDTGRFLPGSPRAGAEMLAELKARVAAMTDPHLRALLEAFLADAGIPATLHAQPRPPRRCTTSTSAACWNIPWPWPASPRTSAAATRGSTRIC